MAVLVAAGISGCETVSVPETPQPVARIDPRRPFAGSPAERYADGPAGIVPPKARAVRGFSVKDVAAAYSRAKKVLTAAHLDRPTLAGGRPNAFIKLLEPDERKEFVKKLDHRDPNENTRIWVTSFAPGEADLVGKVIKVNGSMKAVSVRSFLPEGGRELEIRYDYRFVYAIRNPSVPKKITRVLVHVSGLYSFYRFFEDDKGIFSVEAGSVAVAGAKCESTDGFIHPDYDPVEATESAVDPYGPTAELGGCVPVSRI